MKSRPILFSAPMVRAILSSTKTQTRRVSGLEVLNAEPQRFEFIGVTSGPGEPHYAFRDKHNGAQTLVRYRNGCPGDQLWVRETWAEGIHQMADVDHWAYAADHFGVQQRLGERWKPSIHMPRAASRITLEITEVRVERLGDISEADARAEGASFHNGGQTGHSGWRHDHGDVHTDARSAYARLWNDINGPGSWDLNPWVWALDFRRIT